MKFAQLVFFLLGGVIWIPVAIATEFSLFKALGFLLMWLVIIVFPASRISYRMNWSFMLPTLLLILFTGCGVLFSEQPFQAEQFKKMIMNLGLMFIGFQFIRTRKDVEKVIIALFMSGSLVVLSGLLEISNVGGGRIEGIMGQSNGYAQVCGRLIFCCLGFITFTQKKLFKIFFLVIGALSFYGMLYSGSRGAFFALIATGVVLLTFRGQRTKLLFFAMCAVIIALNFVPTVFTDRLSRTLTVQKAGRRSGIEARWDLIHKGWVVFTKYPVFGAGMGNIRSEIRKIEGIGQVTHNLYTQLLGETGLMGFSAFMIIIFRSWRVLHRGYRNSSSDRREKSVYWILLALFLYLVLGANTAGNYVHSYWYFIFGVIGGIDIIQKTAHSLAVVPGHNQRSTRQYIQPVRSNIG